PEMILLDEVMAGLRPSETDEVVALIRDLRRRGITFLVVEHNMDVIMSISDRVVVIGAGRKVAEGSPEDVVRNPKVVEIYLGEEFEFA
ncbi:MAG: branched-chain amino acid ABC transporter ATP-binding protein, partial [Bradyrhizobium sp.]